MQDANLPTTPFCIAIASHISNPLRVNYLQECLRSLVNQSIHISIYLSISFGSCFATLTLTNVLAVLSGLKTLSNKPIQSIFEVKINNGQELVKYVNEYKAILEYITKISKIKRYCAIIRTRQLLLNLCNPQHTPRLPKLVRDNEQPHCKLRYLQLPRRSF